MRLWFIRSPFGLLEENRLEFSFVSLTSAAHILIQSFSYAKTVNGMKIENSNGGFSTFFL